MLSPQTTRRKLLLTSRYFFQLNLVAELFQEIGVDLDKDVGRSIQKKQEEEKVEVDVSKSKLNPTAASWCPAATKVIKPIQKPSSVNLAPNFANSSKQRRTPPNIQKIAAGDGIYIQTKQKQTTLRSSRDMQNFPSVNGAVQAPKKMTTTGQLTAPMTNSLLTRNLVRCKYPLQKRYNSCVMNRHARSN